MKNRGFGGMELLIVVSIAALFCLVAATLVTAERSKYETRVVTGWIRDATAEADYTSIVFEGDGRRELSIIVIKGNHPKLRQGERVSLTLSRVRHRMSTSWTLTDFKLIPTDTSRPGW